MHIGNVVFSQLMEFAPWHTFRRLVAKYRGDFNVRTFSCLDQFLSMAFAQLTYRESLRDIEACLTSFPVSPEYQRETLRYQEFERAVRLLAAIAERHGVRYVDQRTRFDDSSLFFNPDHLTLAGARRFAPLCVEACFGAGASSLARQEP